VCDTGYSRVLITTNALARGVDVPAVAVVVNFDLPMLNVAHHLQHQQQGPATQLNASGMPPRHPTSHTYPAAQGPAQPRHSRPSGDYVTYVHRIGRCSRFGRRGVAINLLGSEDDLAVMRQIEEYFSPTKRMTTVGGYIALQTHWTLFICFATHLY
jgi:superfamily II DNA/RNA helicase